MYTKQPGQQALARGPQAKQLVPQGSLVRCPRATESSVTVGLIKSNRYSVSKLRSDSQQTVRVIEGLLANQAPQYMQGFVHDHTQGLHTSEWITLSLLQFWYN